jgi:hypothetical protein
LWSLAGVAPHELESVMRLNLLNLKGKDRNQLVDHLIKLVSQDYQVDAEDLMQHLVSGNPDLGEAVVASLQSQGWQVTWYQLPLGRGYHEYDCLSMGFVISENCDAYIAWRLSHHA